MQKPSEQELKGYVVDSSKNNNNRLLDEQCGCQTHFGSEPHADPGLDEDTAVE